MRKLDIEEMMKNGKLHIDPELFEGVPLFVLEKVLADYQRGVWGQPSPEAKGIDYASAGRCLMAAYEVGDAIIHILTDHSNTFMELVWGE